MQKQQMIDFRHKLGEHIQRKQNWPGAKAQKAHEDDADTEVTVSTHSDKHTFDWKDCSQVNAQRGKFVP